MQDELLRTVASPGLADLHAMLDANLGLPPEYRQGLSNHMPMALQALHALGASKVRMEDFYASYERRFEGRLASPPGEALADWRALRGKTGAYPTLLASFRQMLAQEGRATVLRRVLPDLLPGVAAAAFHGAIRTAHAIEAGHQGELAAGLAYWAWRWQDLAPPPPGQPPMSFEVWAARLIREAQGWRSDVPSISGRMAAATQSDVYRDLAAGLWPMPDLVQRLAGLALERYMVSRNFTVLHMITGLRALRVLLPWAGEVDAQAVLVRAFTAAYMAARVASAPHAKASKDLNWRTVIAAALAQDDDHVIKLVHACREEAVAYGDLRYLEAAALAVFATPAPSV